MENTPAHPWYFPMFSTHSKDSAGTELPGSHSHGPLILPGLPWLCTCLLTMCKSLLQNNPSTCLNVYHLHELGDLKVSLQAYLFPCKTRSQVYLKFIPVGSKCDMYLPLVPEIPLLELNLKGSCTNAMRWMITYIH